MIFQIKIMLMELKWQICFKCFINELEFYKNSFKARFSQLAYFMRKLVLGLNGWFWTRFMKYEDYMVFLELVGTRCHTFDEESVNSVWPDHHDNYEVARCYTFGG